MSQHIHRSEQGSVPSASTHARPVQPRCFSLADDRRHVEIFLHVITYLLR